MSVVAKHKGFARYGGSCEMLPKFDDKINDHSKQTNDESGNGRCKDCCHDRKGCNENVYNDGSGGGDALFLDVVLFYKQDI